MNFQAPARALVGEVESPRTCDDLLARLPASDNDPGAPELLCALNREFRLRPWPAPYNQTQHVFRLGDAADLAFIPDESVHLIVTSPPYFNIKEYASDAEGRQLGRIQDYEEFLTQLDAVWRECERVLVPMGRVCCVVGPVTVPRRTGRHWVIPLPSDIQVRSRQMGLDNLTPIIWHKIGNRTNEAGGGSSGFYGKPYQPGAVIKNDCETIVMLRKPGDYRPRPMLQKALSMLQPVEMNTWQRWMWEDVRGASLRNGHPAPYPVELAERLIRLFSFAGDTVLDPFGGSGSTAAAAIRSGRSSISVEIEREYVDMAATRLDTEVTKQAKGGVGASSARLTVET
jgi:site-specific DNA-methyltransferase (adenine-specific)